MTDASMDTAGAPRGKISLTAADARTKRRNAAEKRFRMYGLAAIGTGIFFLVVLLWAILTNGLTAFQQTFIEVPVYLDEAKLDKSGNRTDNGKRVNLTHFHTVRRTLLTLDKALS